MNMKEEQEAQKITAGQVRGVGKWIARGIPEKIACHKEGIDPWHFEIACATDWHFQQIVDCAKADFLSQALNTLMASPGGHRGFQFVLEHVYPELFARPSRSRRLKLRDPAEDDVDWGLRGEGLFESGFRRGVQAVYSQLGD
jgi:hypothetical protein